MTTTAGKARFSVKELMLLMTAVAVNCGAFATFGFAAGASSALLTGIAVYVVGRSTERGWVSLSGESVILLSSAVLLAALSADSSHFASGFFGTLAHPFIGNPKGILIVSGVFLAAAVYVSLLHRRITWEPLLAAIGWGAFAAWEQHCLVRRYNIRVDLFLILPCIAVVTIWAAIRIVRGLYRSWNGFE